MSKINEMNGEESLINRMARTEGEGPLGTSSECETTIKLQFDFKRIVVELMKTDSISNENLITSVDICCEENPVKRKFRIIEFKRALQKLNISKRFLIKLEEETDKEISSISLTDFKERILKFWSTDR